MARYTFVESKVATLNASQRAALRTFLLTLEADDTQIVDFSATRPASGGIEFHYRTRAVKNLTTQAQAEALLDETFAKSGVAVTKE